MTMVKVNITSDNYDFKKTLGKIVREFAIWVLPQIATFLLAANPDFSSMSVGALVSVGVKALQDYAKHK
jgi:hypothetical protein